MAFAYMWGFRRTGAIGRVIVVMNIAMLVAIPFFGGHYLIDMIAGTAVMLMSLGIVKLVPMVRNGMVLPVMRRALATV